MEALEIACAESIALLHLLHSVPAQPQSNSLSRLPKYREGYSLSFEHERRLTSVLAFLSSIKNDPNYIPAVCIRETHQASSLEVLLAVNKGQQCGGNGMLGELKKGFERLFTVLSQVSTADAAQIEQEAFSAIVSMCSSRILYRLRFKKLRFNSSKPSVKKVLQDALDSLKQAEMSSKYSVFVDTATEVIRLIDDWARHQVQHELEALVEGFYRLQKLQGVNSVLDAIPNRLMEPDSRKSLLNIINKVARYRESAHLLCHLAKRRPLLRHMKVVLVQLDPEAFRRTPVENLHPKLASRVSRNNSKNGSPYPLGTICRLLKTTVPKADCAHAQQTRKTLEEAKVHAEIQLLFYCELEKPEFPPRVVCSSKDACFLCNAFISMHGKMHTPRSHGRLYPGWRLPRVGSTDLHSKFVKYLDSLIGASLATLISRGTKTVYPDPNESTLLTLPLSTTTICSQGTHHSAIQTDAKNLPQLSQLPPLPPPESVEEGVTEPSPLVSPKNSDDGSRSDERRVTDLALTEIMKSPELNEERLQHLTPISSLSELLSISSITGEDDNQQIPGSVQQPEMVSADSTSPFYSDGVLEVHVEYSPSPSTTAPVGSTKQLPFSVEWFGADEVERARESQAHPVIDAETMEAEITLALNDQNSILISTRGSLVKVTFGLPKAVNGEIRDVGTER